MDHTREKLIELLKDDDCHLLWMHGYEYIFISHGERKDDE